MKVLTNKHAVAIYMRANVIGIGSMLLVFALAVVFAVIPALAEAQSGVGGSSGTASGLLGTLALANRILNGLVGLAVLAAILAFFWGLLKYLFQGGGENKSEGLKIMFYGVIAIFVMVSIWGIIRLLQNTFGVTQNTSITPAGIQSF
ncbi:hypothetical protein HY970_02930 [Candidatus Kaiserbacteria bacterium]|nr:hypothetical protein [Candidatus Kaiserbacteria bacterium]